MKNKDLIAALQEHDPELEVAVFDWRKNAIGAELGGSVSFGIYQDIKVEKMEPDPEETQMPEEDRLAATWLALSFTNEDYEDNFAEMRNCRACGCTDLDCRQCIQKTGQPCSWVEEDLCSACVEQESMILVPGRDF